MQSITASYTDRVIVQASHVMKRCRKGGGKKKLKEVDKQRLKMQRKDRKEDKGEE